MKIDIVSGFLGAGKTTFLNKILPDLRERVVIIENEYGDISVDGSLLQDNLPVREIMAGCICCSLVVDFQQAIQELSAKYHPDRIIIEPSGVSCLSDVVKACEMVADKTEGGLELDHLITIVDMVSFPEYIDDFGIFYANQIEHANVIFFSHLSELGEAEQQSVIKRVRQLNPRAAVWQEDWLEQDGGLLWDWLSGLTASGRPQDASELKRLIFNAHDVFGSWATDSDHLWRQEEIEEMLRALGSGDYGRVLRAKGILPFAAGGMVGFNFTPQHREFHPLKAKNAGKIAVIGCRLQKEKLARLFQKAPTNR